jgi:hypothetical protein
MHVPKYPWWTSMMGFMVDLMVQCQNGMVIPCFICRFELLLASSKFSFWWTIYINFEFEKHGIPNQDCIGTFKHVAFVGNSISAIFAFQFYTQGILDFKVKKLEQHTSLQTVSRTLSREEHHNDANCMFTCWQLRRNEIGKLLYPH